MTDKLKARIKAVQNNAQSIGWGASPFNNGVMFNAYHRHYRESLTFVVYDVNDGYNMFIIYDKPVCADEQKSVRQRDEKFYAHCSNDDSLVHSIIAYLKTFNDGREKS